MTWETRDPISPGLKAHTRPRTGTPEWAPVSPFRAGGDPGPIGGPQKGPRTGNWGGSGGPQIGPGGGGPVAPYSCLPAGFKWERPISRARGGSQSPGRVWISTPEDLFRGPGVEIRPWAGIGARRAGSDRFAVGFCLGSAWV